MSRSRTHHRKGIQNVDLFHHLKSSHWRHKGLVLAHRPLDAAIVRTAVVVATYHLLTMAEEAPIAEGGKKKFERKKDETPIEELYDLSKPIPRVRF